MAKDYKASGFIDHLQITLDFLSKDKTNGCFGQQIHLPS